MPRKFGGYRDLSPRKRWEIIQELRDNKKNGPVVVTHKDDPKVDQDEEASTDEEK